MATNPQYLPQRDGGRIAQCASNAAERNTDITGIQVQGNFKGENRQRAGSGMAKVDVVSGSNTLPRT